MIRRQLNLPGPKNQFFRFLLANTFAAMANIASKLVASFVLSDALAVIAGFLVGLSSSYILCRSYVFQSNQDARRSEAMRFTAINLMALAITYFTYKQMLAGFHLVAGLSQADRRVQTTAHAIGVAAPLAFSFIAQKTLTFHQPLR
jgi:putative flippase GtrA